MASFFLVYFYSSVLISFISASNKVPVIEKLTDLPSKPEVRVVTNYGWSADAILSVSDQHMHLPTVYKDIKIADVTIWRFEVHGRHVEPRPFTTMPVDCAMR